MRPTRKLTDWLFPTLTVPFWTAVDAPPGPVIVQLTAVSWAPPGSVSCIPTLPVPSSDGTDEDPFSPSEPSGPAPPVEEQPDWAPAKAAVLAAPRRKAFNSDLRTMDLMSGLRGLGPNVPLIRKCLASGPDGHDMA